MSNYKYEYVLHDDLQSKFKIVERPTPARVAKGLIVVLDKVRYVIVNSFYSREPEYLRYIVVIKREA